MAEAKDISNSVRAAYSPEQNYLTLRTPRTQVYLPPVDRAREASRKFDYFQHRRN